MLQSRLEILSNLINSANFPFPSTFCAKLAFKWENLAFFFCNLYWWNKCLFELRTHFVDSLTWRKNPAKALASIFPIFKNFRTLIVSILLLPPCFDNHAFLLIVSFNPITTNVPIIKKPVSWFAEQINWLVSIWWVVKGLNFLWFFFFDSIPCSGCSALHRVDLN